MIEFTPKEVEKVGENRYLGEKGRWWKTMLVLIGAICIALLVATFTKSVLPELLRKALEVIAMVVGFGYFLKVYCLDASKAGKKFREEWEKERKK